MFGLGSDDDGPDLGDQMEAIRSRLTRDGDRKCDICGSSEGSVVVNRETDTARCNDCFNDPGTWPEDE